MAITYTPVIRSQDYEALRCVLDGHIPNTHDAWEKRQTDEVAQIQKAGHTVRIVNVDPNEFARFLNATGAAHDLHSLDIFTREKSGGKQY
jgi:hypothetical protein